MAERIALSSLLVRLADAEEDPTRPAGMIRLAARLLLSAPLDDAGACEGCGGEVERANRGRPKRFCSSRCRSRDHRTKSERNA